MEHLVGQSGHVISETPCQHRRFGCLLQARLRHHKRGGFPRSFPASLSFNDETGEDGTRTGVMEGVFPLHGVTEPQARHEGAGPLVGA